MTAGRDDAVSLDAKVRFLSQPESYPTATASVRTVETHMSWVFVTDELVFKMKKPVRMPFLDFSTLEQRRYFCGESLRLNRRLAAQVYLGVVPLALDQHGTLRIGGPGQPVEWLEKMRRLPAGRMLDEVIARGDLNDADVRRAAAVLARFYRSERPIRLSLPVFRQRLLDAIDANRRALEADELHLDRDRLHRLADGLGTFLRREGALLEARLEDGRIVEAHGDLRPEHVCLLDEPVFIDCLEFSRDLRIMDVADELSYLALECELAGAPAVGPLLFDTYQAESGDQVPARLVGFYQTCRALLRAKLAAWHLPDYPPETHGHWLAQAAAYLDLADRHLPGQQGVE